MKKYLMFFTAAVLVAGLACSCNKDPKPNNNQNGEEEGEKIENLITIDGEFNDWKGVQGVSVAEVPDVETAYPCLLTMKAVADNANVYFYFEYQGAEDQTKAPFTLEINSDGDPGSGFADHLWSDAGWDFAIESSAGFFGATNYTKMNDLKLLVPNADIEPGAQRSWDPKNYTDKTAKGVKNRGTLKNGVYMFEINVPRVLIEAEKKGTIFAGAYVETQDWETVGVLPIDNGVSLTEMLEIDLP